MLEKIGNKAREMLWTVPPAERKPPSSGTAEIRSNKAGEPESEMEVEESEAQARRPDIKTPPPAKAASGPQATKAVRRVFSPTRLAFGRSGTHEVPYSRGPTGKQDSGRSKEEIRT